ncbi:hypothetical protein ANCDUO_10084 [Ancylostoma duodenale]|uniref:Uncharacterized protein n=1 Tax=Ancylostoma duodenale TaxID=51022 RepID=A0A0C2GES4_9BILA|nr:hypothetical protein ANCDUO_10084 [Ancylostoma duodenale]
MTQGYRHWTNLWPSKTDKNAFLVAKQRFNVADMKLLLAAGASAVVTFIFTNVSLFTREWVTATLDQPGIHLAQSVGIFPWWCLSDNTCSYFWNRFLFTLDSEFTPSRWLPISTPVRKPKEICEDYELFRFLVKRRYHFAKGFAGSYAVILILLLFVVIAFGITYKKNLGYSYWLCLVAAAFSIVTVGLAAKALDQVKKDRGAEMIRIAMTDH